MISVVVPAFNEEKFLPQCLESLKKQDYSGDYEVIVADNGSTDATREIARKFGSKIVLCSRKGVAYARQAGAEAAEGEIIVQADADTVYPQDWLTRIAKHFASNPKSVALAGIFIYRDPPWWAGIEHFLRLFGNLIIGIPFFRRPIVVSGANFAFRRDAFLKANGYDPGSLYPDQWGICRRLARVGKISYQISLAVATSSRRVQKPAYRIGVDFIMNSMRVCMHFFRYGFSILNSFLSNVPMLRTPARMASAAVLLGVIGVLVVGYAVPSSQVFGKVYYKSKIHDKVVALTFDDGPNEPYTSEILDTLDKYDVQATFFLVGKNVEIYPSVAKRMLAEGDVIGNHTYSHKANHAVLYDGNLDIKRGQDAITQIVGVKPHLYRPPHGKHSPWELEYLKKEDLIEVTWSAQANELHSELMFGKPTSDEIAKEIIGMVKPGAIILLHDGYGTEHNDANSNKSVTVEALPKIITELEKRGYDFVTVPELLGVPAYNK